MMKTNVFLKKKRYLWGLIDQTYKFGEERMTHRKKKRKKEEKRRTKLN